MVDVDPIRVSESTTNCLYLFHSFFGEIQWWGVDLDTNPGVTLCFFFSRFSKTPVCDDHPIFGIGLQLSPWSGMDASFSQGSCDMSPDGVVGVIFKPGESKSCGTRVLRVRINAIRVWGDQC